MRRYFNALIVLVALSGLAACSSPTAPESSGGVTITGSVAAPGGANGSTDGAPASAGSTTSSIPPGLTVTAVGTNITTTVDPSGQFVLRQLPSGNVQLRFNAVGTSATLTLTGLEAGQQVTIVVSLTNSTAALLSELRSGGAALNLNGIISNFTGTPAAFEFMVNGQLVKGDALTEFYGNSQFNELADGMRVEVKGSQRAGFVYATRIHVNIEDVEITGVIVGPITGTSPNLTFLVGGTTVKTGPETDVQRKGDKQTPAQLQVGMTVELTGGLLPNGTVVAKKIHIVADAVGGLFQMSGSAGGRSGTCPTISFSVSGYDIVTSGATVFVPTCSAISNGSKVTVIGIVQASGAINATSVEKQ